MVRAENHLSTWFIQDEYVGVKWNWKARVGEEPHADRFGLMGCVVVKDDMNAQLLGYVLVDDL